MKPTAAIAALVAVSSMILLVTAAHSKSPPGTLTIVTASQGGLMTDSGPLNPHAYRPNEFVLQDMLYEGLVHYGEDGKLVPALAESWVYKPGGAGSPPTINFNLRKGVTFHDGTPWDAAACKANFDNVFDKGLINYHGWYDLPFRIQSWKVVDSHTFEVTLDKFHYPALQEFTFIRPARFLSPKDLPQLASQRSCPTTAQRFWPTNVTQYSCVGTFGVSGTGPWVFEKKVTNLREIGPKEASLPSGQVNATLGEKLLEMHFTRNTKHWDTKAGGNIQKVVIKMLATLSEVAPAIAEGSVDMVYGLDTIGPQQFKDLHLQDEDNLKTYISQPLSTRAVIVNSNKPPLDLLAVRKAIMHAMDKQDIIARELAGLEPIAYTLFSSNIPYMAGVDLVPPLGYDPEKVKLILDSAGWLMGGDGVRRKNGVPLEVEFVYRTTRSIEVALEDDIRRNLEGLGFRVINKGVVHDEFNQRTAAGDFHLAFDTTLGVPWDPPTTAAYWRVYGSFVNAFAKMSDRSPTPEGFTLKHPMNFTQFGNLVGDVLVSTTEVQRQSLWAKIYTVVHEQAILAPLSYLVNVAVVRDRFENFVFGYQQYDMQLHKLVDRELLGAAANANVATSPQLSKGAIAAIVVCSIAAATAIAFVAFLVHRERSGKPMFSRLIEESHRENAKGGFGMSHSAGEPDVVTKAAKTSNGTAV